SSGDPPALHSFPTRRSSDLLPELLSRLRIDGLQVAFQRPIERDVTGRHERSAPGGELLLVAPHDLAVRGVPSDKGAHVSAGAREDRKSTRLNSSHDQISYAV